MKKVFTINGNKVTFEEIRYVYGDETEIQDGLLVHEGNDEFNDGDCIIGNMNTMPETDEDAADMLEYEHSSTYITLRDDGIWHVEA